MLRIKAGSNGMPRCAAAISGWMALLPPISIDMTPRNRHQLDGPRGQPAVDEPLLAHQRRAHVGNDRDVVIVLERLRVHQGYARALAIEPAHVDEPVIRAAAAAGAQDPGTDRQRFDIVGGDLFHECHRPSMRSRLNV